MSSSNEEYGKFDICPQLAMSNPLIVAFACEGKYDLMAKLKAKF